MAKLLIVCVLALLSVSCMDMVARIEIEQLKERTTKIERSDTAQTRVIREMYLAPTPETDAVYLAKARVAGGSVATPGRWVGQPDPVEVH